MYATDFSQVGSNIKAVLDTQGKTQQYLADRLSVSKQVMNKIIKGSKAINVNEISMIARVLQTSADDLLTVSELPAEDNWLTFMGMIKDQETMEKVNLIRTAIDEIGMLEELLYE